MQEQLAARYLYALHQADTATYPKFELGSLQRIVYQHRDSALDRHPVAEVSST